MKTTKQPVAGDNGQPRVTDATQLLWEAYALAAGEPGITAKTPITRGHLVAVCELNYALRQENKILAQRAAARNYSEIAPPSDDELIEWLKDAVKSEYIQ
jgi:hypothetical protein